MANRNSGRRKSNEFTSFLAIGAASAAAALGVAILGATTIRLRKRSQCSLLGRVVLVTGGSRGLGLAMAQEFAQRGAKLVICGRDPESLQKAESRLRANGVDVMAIPCDISSGSEAEALIDRVIKHHGQIDVLVNNAGEIAVGPMESQTVEDFERAMNIMFWGMVYTTMAVLPQMRARRAGRIVNITSIGGKVAVPHLLPYACAKFAALGFSEGLRAESTRHGIKVTTVVPGLLRTGSHINAIFKGDHRKEYGWFSLAATSRVTAMDAHRAARRIVDTAVRGKAEIILTPQAQLLAWMHGIAPGLVTDVLAIANRLIPGTGGVKRESHLGRDSESVISRSLVSGVGRDAEQDLNQHSKENPVTSSEVGSRPGTQSQNDEASPLPAD
jgi:short-subunit dehydrogenase